MLNNKSAALRPSFQFACVLLALAGMGCEASTSETESETNSDGQALYEAPHDDGNTFACSTCHALSEPTADGYTRPGHPIGDAANRPHFKNEQLATLREAVNTCRADWMGAPPFAPDDARWLALEAFLEEQAGEATAPALVFEVADPPTDLAGGDPVAGESTFNRTCVVCHGEGAIGTERAPSIAGTMLAPDFIANKVRRSGNGQSAIYPGLTFGRMPFWQRDRVSDDELRDILAFLEMSVPVDMPNNPTDGVDLSQSSGQSNCSAGHPAVGRSMTFSTIAHDVAGTATVVDDCTIELTDFTFDGGGIDVRLYGGNGGNYDGGTNLSINLVGSAFDQGTATLRLPDGVSLDDFDGLSVWCVPVGLSFGDGIFQ